MRARLRPPAASSAVPACNGYGIAATSKNVDLAYERAKRVHVWNTRPKNLEYYTEKWNEFLAA